MKLCMIGKFPPIQGGVSVRMYHLAHSLAKLGHQVHVVTNASEVRPPFRIMMRDLDWESCKGNYEQGTVQVHWTDTVSRAQSHIPWHNPFVTKLASLATDVALEHRADLIFSYYLEPYAVAGHLAAEMSDLPHVVKLAGSDAGRLRRLKQFGPLYDHIIRSADCVFVNRTVAEELEAGGVDRERLQPALDFRLPSDLFTPEGPSLDLPALGDEVSVLAELPELRRQNWEMEGPFIGVYGKLGDRKGTFELLDAVRNVSIGGQKVSLLVMGHARPTVEGRFHETVSALDLKDSVLQLPFLPHWRVPEFIRRCLVVCCLEQDFPIAFHAPLVPREVLLSGGCLVATAEILRKLPSQCRLAHGYNCVAVTDVRDVPGLARTLASIIHDPQRVHEVGSRARKYAMAAQDDIEFPINYESAFARVVEKHPDHNKKRRRRRSKLSAPPDSFALTRLGLRRLSPEQQKRFSSVVAGYGHPIWTSHIGKALREAVASGESSIAVQLDVVRLEAQIAEAARGSSDPSDDSEYPNPLFRLQSKHWAILRTEILDLVPRQLPTLRMEQYQHDVNAILRAKMSGVFPPHVAKLSTQVLSVHDRFSGEIRVIVLDHDAASLLLCCDGTRSVRQIATQFKRYGCGESGIKEICSDISALFELGLIRLSEGDKLLRSAQR